MTVTDDNGKPYQPKNMPYNPIERKKDETDHTTYTHFLFTYAALPGRIGRPIVIRGIVIDRESQLPVEAATVQLTRGNASLPINYTLSNNEGTFTLTQPKRTDSLLVSVSLLGYQTQQQAVHAGQTLRFEMEPQVFSLKEVEIRPGRVWGRQDTINYDVTRFLSQRINPSRTYYGNFRVSISMIWGRSLTTGKISVIFMWRDWISPTGNTSKSARTCEPTPCRTYK